MVMFMAGTVAASAPSPAVKCRTIAAASAGPMPLAPVSSSARGGLDALDGAELRPAGPCVWTSPSPGTPSSAETVMALPRFCRWKVIAKRWASSRIRCSRYRPAEARGQDHREVAVRQPDLLQPLGQADHVDVLDAQLRQGAGGGVDLRLAAVDDDEVGRVGEFGPRRRRGGVRDRRGGCRVQHGLVRRFGRGSRLLALRGLVLRDSAGTGGSGRRASPPCRPWRRRR